MGGTNEFAKFAVPKVRGYIEKRLLDVTASAHYEPSNESPCKFIEDLGSCPSAK